MMASGVPARDDAANQLALRWMALLEAGHRRQPGIAVQLDTMHANEPSVQRETGISLHLKGYIMRAIAEVKFDIYTKYLSPEEIGHMRRHQETRAYEWPSLIERVREQMRADPSPDSARARELAGSGSTFPGYGRDGSGNCCRFRLAVESEPLLQMGRGMPTR